MQYTNIENVPSEEHLVSASMVSAVDKRNTNRRINVKNKREQKSIRYETLLALTFTLINSLTPFPGRTVTCLKLGDIRSRILFQTKHLKYSKNKKQEAISTPKVEQFLVVFSWLVISSFGSRTQRRTDEQNCKNSAVRGRIWQELI